MKKDCEIIKDLLPNYVENLVSNQTRAYVEDHISNCTECRQLLNNMQADKVVEKETTVKEEQAEIRNINRYRRKSILTKVMIGILIIIVIAGAGIFSKYARNSSVIFTAYNKLQEIKDTENFKITIEEHDSNNNDEVHITRYFYKDGKYKKEVFSNNNTYSQVYYGEINSTSYIFIDKNTNELINSTSYSLMPKSDFFVMFTDINFNATDKGIIPNLTSMLSFDIRTEEYNGKDCYVLKHGGEISYREIWIDKDTMLQVKSIQKNNNDTCYETIYSIERNATTDEDITLQNTESYIIKE